MMLGSVTEAVEVVLTATQESSHEETAATALNSGYRVGMVVGYRVGLTVDFVFCHSTVSPVLLGQMEIGWNCRSGWSVGQYGETRYKGYEAWPAWPGMAILSP